jgi:23S rRNA pseudouridine1911/1915/1917 synthase
MQGIEPFILLETAWYLVVNKPAGLNVERLPQGFPSVEEWVQQYQVQQGVKKPYTGIVHRLDRPVSGALIVAKKKQALKDLNEQFRERKVKKIYLALVEGKPGIEQQELVHWVEKDQKNKKAIAHSRQHREGFQSILRYEVVREYGPTTLLKVEPITGKFHQIRVQLAAMGCPIVGDAKYGAHTPYQTDGIALHAYQIHFTDPLNQRAIMVEAPGEFAL